MVSSKSYVRAGRHASKEGKTAAYEQYLPHTDVSILMVDHDCRRMRESVNKLLTGGSFTKEELCKAVACSAASVHFSSRTRRDSRTANFLSMPETGFSSAISLFPSSAAPIRRQMNRVSGRILPDC